MSEQTPRPKKSLGQHFLKDARIAAGIVELLGVNGEDQVLEIGPGPGALTSFLRSKAPARLLLVEKDAHWAAHHATLGAHEPWCEVRAMDAMEMDWNSLAGPWKIISNLPYNVGSPLIWDLVSQTPDLVRGVFMVQKEVAERLVAAPGCGEYGALSVWVQSYARVDWGFVVKPGAFTPPPKVDSAVVVLTPLPAAARPDQPENLAAVLRMAFQQRRKQLRSILRRQGFDTADSLLEGLGIAPEARPETLSPSLFQQLGKALAVRQKSGCAQRIEPDGPVCEAPAGVIRAEPF